MKRFLLLLSFVIIGVSSICRTTCYTNSLLATSTLENLWRKASENLQSTINTVIAGETIFVAQGVYSPQRPVNIIHAIDKQSTNRDNAFLLSANVYVCAGFFLYIESNNKG